MNEKEFYDAINDLGIEITEQQKKSLQIYCEFLISENQKTNLTAIKEPAEIYLKHFYDSLTITKVVDLTKINNLLDIGSGAGFPGMVIKIFFPAVEVTLLDSNNKKISFLKSLASKLKLENIQFIQERAEEFIKTKRDSFDLVTARAVANLTTLSELSLPFVKVNGYFIPLKGSNEIEIKEATYAIKTLGGEIEKIMNFTLPYESGTRNILKIKKINNTPTKYPRRYEKILKNPLKK